MMRRIGVFPLTKINSEPNAVIVQLERVDERGIVRVHNPGAPIPESVHARLFERFYRADTSRYRDSDGAGLGLAIVEAIAHAHGGEASVESSDDGNTCLFWIPIGDLGFGPVSQGALA